MEQYDNETIKQLNSWFLEQKEKGFTPDQIKQSMIDNGYEPEFCDEFIAKKVVLYQESVTVPDNQTVSDNQTQTNDNSNQNTKTNTSEQTPNTWQTKTDENNSETLSEAQKQEIFKKYSYVDKVKLILTKPKQFFDEMPQEDEYKEPIKFAATNIIVLFSIAIIGMLLLSASGTAFASLMGLAIIIFIPSMIFMGIVAIIGFVVSVFIGAAINNTWFKLFKCRGTYKATANVFFYMTAVNLLILIPIVGFLSPLYQIYVMITGLAKIHNISKAKTLAITIIFGIVVSIIFMILFAIMFTLLISVFDNLGSMMVPATIN